MILDFLVQGVEAVEGEGVEGVKMSLMFLNLSYSLHSLLNGKMALKRRHF